MSSFFVNFRTDSLLVFISIDDNGFAFLVDVMIVRTLKIMFSSHCTIGVHENVVAYKIFSCLL